MEYRTSDAICGVYKIVNNVNDKAYIGQSINIKLRWKDHINSLNRNNSKCTLLQRAWNKYGQENFSFEILELCAEDMLDSVEIKYINIYDTLRNGYNIESGGNSNKRLSEETKKKISEAHIGKIASNETRRKMSESRMGQNNSMYGQRHSDSSKQKMSDAKKGKPGHAQTDYQKERARAANFGKEVSEETRRKIGEANRGNIPYNRNPRPVYCVELQKVFECAAIAGKELNIRSGNVINCCEYTRKTCGGYHWMYADTIEYTGSLTTQN